MQSSMEIESSPRHPWIAVPLSLVVWGLGQVYCGRIVKGLVLLLIGSSFGPVLAALFTLGHARWHVIVLVASAVALGVLWLYTVVDAYVTARRTAADYRLKDYNRWYVYLLLAGLSLPMGTSYALLIREGFYEAFHIVARSMTPTLKLGDRVLVDKRAYRFEPIARGDIVVFISPDQRQQHWIKRVVALPGDTVEMKANELSVNGEKLRRIHLDSNAAEPEDDRWRTETFWELNGLAKYRVQFLEHHPKDIEVITDFPPTTIPAGHCFLLGDNRNRSEDGRHHGPTPLVDVVGRVDCVYYPRWSGLDR